MNRWPAIHWLRRERLWHKRTTRFLLAAVFWTLFGWMAHDMALQWMDSGNECVGTCQSDDDEPPFTLQDVMEVGRI